MVCMVIFNSRRILSSIKNIIAITTNLYGGIKKYVLVMRGPFGNWYSEIHLLLTQTTFE